MGNSKNWLAKRARNKQLIDKAKKIAAGALVSAVIIGPLIYFGAVAVPVEIREARKSDKETVTETPATPEVAVETPATPEVVVSETPIEFPETKEKKVIDNGKVEFVLADLPNLEKENVNLGNYETVEENFVETLKSEFKDNDKDVSIKSTKKLIEGQEETLYVMENIDIDDGPRKIQKEDDADSVARAALRRYLKTNPKEADFDIYKDTSKIKNSKKTYQLVVEDIKTNAGKWYVTFQQYKNALPVFDGNVKMIFTERKKLLTITDNLRTEIPEDTTFQVSNIDATDATKEIFEWDDQEDKIDFVNKGYYKNKPAFKIDVDSHNPLGQYEVFINGIDGKVENIGGDIRLGTDKQNRFLAQITENLIEPLIETPATPSVEIDEEGLREPKQYSEEDPTLLAREEEPYLFPEDLNPNKIPDDIVYPEIPEFPVEEAVTDNDLGLESKIYLKTIEPITNYINFLESPSETELPEQPLYEQPATPEVAATPQAEATPQAGATPEPEIVILDTLFSQVLGKIYPEYPTQEAEIRPFANAYAYYNSQQFITDREGFFENKDMNWYSVFLDGPYVTVHDDDATSNTDIKDRTPEDPFVWDENSASLEAINAFYHTNKLHEYFKEQHDFDLNKNIELTVNSELVDQYINGCGAWFDNANKTIEMGRGGTEPCPDDLNYALGSDFLYHEYTHFVVEEITHLPNIAGSESAAMGEGLADYFAASINDDSEWGEVIAPNDTRQLFNTLNYKTDMTGESHQDGQIFAGALWDLRMLIGQEEADRLIFNTLYQDRLHFETFMYGLLIEDDGNDDFSDGTPHMLQIIAAFQRHGIGPGIEDFDGLPIDPELWSELLEEEAPTGLEQPLTQGLSTGTGCTDSGGTTGYILVDSGATCYWTSTDTRNSLGVGTSGTLYIGNGSSYGTLSITADANIYGTGTSSSARISMGAYGGSYYGRLYVYDELKIRNGGRVFVYNSTTDSVIAAMSTQIYETSSSYTAATGLYIYSDSTSNSLTDTYLGNEDNIARYGDDCSLTIYGQAQSTSVEADNSSSIANSGIFIATSPSTFENDAYIINYNSSSSIDFRSYLTMNTGSYISCSDDFDMDNTITFNDDSYFDNNSNCIFTPTTATFNDTSRYISDGGSLTGGTTNFYDTSYADINSGTYSPTTANFYTSSYADQDGGTFGAGTATFSTNAYVDINGSSYFSPTTATFNNSASMRHRGTGTASDGNATFNDSARLYYYGGSSNFGTCSFFDTSILYAHSGTATATNLLFYNSGRFDKHDYGGDDNGDGAVSATYLTFSGTSYATHNVSAGTVSATNRLLIDDDAYYDLNTGTLNANGTNGAHVLGTTYTSQSGALIIDGGTFNASSLRIYENGWVDQNGGTINVTGNFTIETDASLYDNDGGTATVEYLAMSNDSEIQNDGTINIQQSGLYMTDTSLVTNNYNTSGSAYIYLNEPLAGHSTWSMDTSSGVENRTGGYITAQTGATYGDHLEVFDNAQFTNRGNVIFQDGYIGKDGGGDPDYEGGLFVNEYINGPGYVDFYGNLNIVQGTFVNKSDTTSSYGAYVRGNAYIKGYYSSSCDIGVLQNQGDMRIEGNLTMDTHTDSSGYSCSRIQTIDAASITDNRLLVGSDLTATEDYSEIYGSGSLYVQGSLSMTAPNSYIDIQEATMFRTTTLYYDGQTADFFVGDTLNIGGYLVKLIAQSDITSTTGTITIEHYPTYTFADDAAITGNYAGAAYVNEPSGPTYGSFTFNRGSLEITNDLIINNTGASAPYLENAGYVGIGPSTTSSLQLNGNSYINNEENDLTGIVYDSQVNNFTIGETITGEFSGATAIVTVDLDSGPSGTLLVSNSTGRFFVDEKMNGSISGAAYVDVGSNNHLYPDATISVDQADPGTQTRGQFQIYNDAAVTNYGTIRANVLWVGDSPTLTAGGAFTNSTTGNVDVSYTGDDAVQFYNTDTAENQADSGWFTVDGQMSISSNSFANKTTFQNYNYATIDSVNIGQFGQLSVNPGDYATLDYDGEITGFTLGEQIEGQTSGAVGVVGYIVDNGSDGTLTLIDSTGTFIDDEKIQGTAGGDAYANGIDSRTTVTSPGVSYIMDDTSNPETQLNSGILYVQQYCTFDATGGSINLGTYSSATGGEVTNYGTIKTDDLYMQESSGFLNNDLAEFYSYNLVELGYDYSANDYDRTFTNRGYVEALDVNINGDNAWYINDNNSTNDTYIQGNLEITGGEYDNVDGSGSTTVDGHTWVKFGSGLNTHTHGELYNEELFNSDTMYVTGYVQNGTSAIVAEMNILSTSGVEDLHVNRIASSSTGTGKFLNINSVLNVGDATGGEIRLEGEYDTLHLPFTYYIAEFLNSPGAGGNADVNTYDFYVYYAADLTNDDNIDVGNKFWSGDNISPKNIYNNNGGDVNVTGSGDLWLYDNTTWENYNGSSIDADGLMKIMENGTDTTVNNYENIDAGSLYVGDKDEYKGGDLNNESGGDIDVNSDGLDAGKVYYGSINLMAGSGGFDVVGTMTIVGDSSSGTSYGKINATDGSYGDIPMSTYGGLIIQADGIYDTENDVEVETGAGAGQTGDVTIAGSAAYPGVFYLRPGDPATTPNESTLYIKDDLIINAYGMLLNYSYRNIVTSWASGGVVVLDDVTVYANGAIMSDNDSSFYILGTVNTAGYFYATDDIKAVDFNETGGTTQFGQSLNVGITDLTGTLTVSNGSKFTSYNHADLESSYPDPDGGFTDITITGANTRAYFQESDASTTLECSNDVHGYMDILDTAIVYVNCETDGAVVVHAGSPGGTTLVEGGSTLVINTNFETDDMIVGGTGSGLVTHDVVGRAALYVPTGSISQITDFGGTQSTVTTASPSYMEDGDLVTISGTTNYNGTWIVSNTYAGSNYFNINMGGYATETSGTWTQVINSNSSFTVFDLLVNNDLTINSNGSLDVSNKSHYDSYNTAAGTFGGTHGGKGQSNSIANIEEYGIATSFYDSATYDAYHPDFGSSGIYDGGSGVNVEAKGGGKMKIKVIGDLVNNGVIRANGQSGDNYTHEASGSGGSVMIWSGDESAQTGTMSGSGVIEAKGGRTTSTTSGYGGGGGRIYIDYIDKSGYTGDITAEGGTAARSSITYAAAPGSVFYRWRDPWENQRRGTLVIKGNDSKNVDLALDGSVDYNDAYHVPDGTYAGPTSPLGSMPYFDVDSVQIEDNGALYPMAALLSGSITHLEDLGGNSQVTTATPHYFGNGDQVTISGTTNYNGTWTVLNASTYTFDISITGYPDEFSGTWSRTTGYNIVQQCITESGSIVYWDGGVVLQYNTEHTPVNASACYMTPDPPESLVINDSSLGTSGGSIQQSDKTHVATVYDITPVVNAIFNDGELDSDPAGTYDSDGGTHMEIQIAEALDTLWTDDTANYTCDFDNEALASTTADGNNFSADEEIQQPPCTLAANTSYYWRMRIKDDESALNGWGLWSETGQLDVGEGGTVDLVDCDIGTTSFDLGSFVTDDPSYQYYGEDTCTFVSEATVDIEMGFNKSDFLTHSTSTGEIGDMERGLASPLFDYDYDPTTGLDGLNKAGTKLYNEVGFYTDLTGSPFTANTSAAGMDYDAYFTYIPDSITDIFTSAAGYSTSYFDIIIGAFIHGIHNPSDPTLGGPSGWCYWDSNDNGTPCITRPGDYSTNAVVTLVTPP